MGTLRLREAWSLALPHPVVKGSNLRVWGPEPSGVWQPREREGEDVAGQARGGARVATVRARRCPAGQAAGAGLALLACAVGAGRTGCLACITAGDAPGGHRDHPFCSTGWTTYSTWPTESRGNSAPTPLPPAPRCPSSDPCPVEPPPHPRTASLAVSALSGSSTPVRLGGCGAQ